MISHHFPFTLPSSPFPNHINLPFRFSFHLSDQIPSQFPSSARDRRLSLCIYIYIYALMEGHHLQQYHHQTHHLQQQQQRNISVNAVDATSVDRFPQWSVQETKEFLMIRAELDPSFMETKRNKVLWEVISTKMKDRGFNRSAEQCKCKWKNLVTRYKGCETMEEEAMRQQFPFYNEMQSLFTARMQRMLWVEAEGGASSSKRKASPQLSSDEEDDVTEFSEGDKSIGGRSRKKKMKSHHNPSSSGNNKSSVITLLEDFMKQQLQMELQWREAVELRENEKRMREMEWRQKMEELENERIMMDRRWREREEQRRMREDARAEKRDALITALLNKLRREDNS